MNRIVQPGRGRRQIGAWMILAMLVAGQPAAAGEVEILEVTVVPDGPGTRRFTVTLRHADTGWEHYADRWEIRLLDGTLLGSRVLLHPHVTEQPFSRSLGGVAVPQGVDRVLVQAHDKLHGWSTEPRLVPLPPPD